MNGSGFGFSQYPQKPTVTPQAAGQALQQQMPASPMPDQQMVGAQAAGQPAPHAMVSGASGSRFVPDPEPDPAMLSAVKAAVVRLRNKTAGTQSQPRSPSPGSAAQLHRLGMSLQQISLMQQTGGSN